MKISTITCHNVYNHGASLQAYALSAYLCSLGHEVEIINYRPDLQNAQPFYTSVPQHYDRFGLRQAYIVAKLPSRVREAKRRKAFDLFTQQYMPIGSTIYTNLDALSANPPAADLYIAGSDQIWNTELRTDAAFYLDFGPKETKRISYAASFATTQLREGTEDFVKSQLANFDEISVREESGINILQSLGYSGTLVVDPVFLLSREHWERIASEDGCGECYILVYDFERGGPIETIAKRLARLMGCKIYSIGFEGKRYTHRDFVTYGPSSFVSLIRNAACVVSNSFHATAFSMIFQKNFFVVNRTDGLNVRMSDLLSRYGLSDRLIDVNATDKRLTSNIDYTNVQPILHQHIAQSKDFIPARFH